MEISQDDFRNGCLAYQEKEKRDAMYKVATFLVEHYWGNTAEMADSLGVLLLTWNQAFYRYGPFSFDNLEKCLSENWNLFNTFRNRDILSFSFEDEKPIRHLFKQMLLALQICEGAKAGNKSPVAVAKTLHLLAPAFFPIWDDAISRAYNCYYLTCKYPEDKYITFMKRMKQIALSIETFPEHYQLGKTLLKLIDEYNYAKFTKSWI
jgi:hypothetical protein